MHVFQRIGKENQQNLSEIKPSYDFSEEELEIEEQIGAGTFGKVYRARLRSSGQLVALKRVQQDKKYKTR
jgi:serine/threonine protein kinase